MARRVLMAEVYGGRVQQRTILGRMDGVKAALGNRGMTVEAGRQWQKFGKMGSPGARFSKLRMNCVAVS